MLGWHLVSVGHQYATLADPKIIFQAALAAHASSIIVSHNHPSGNIKPSLEYNKLTNRIRQVGELLEMPPTDHIILGLENEYSVTLTRIPYFDFADDLASSASSGCCMNFLFSRRE